MCETCRAKQAIDEIISIYPSRVSRQTPTRIPHLFPVKEHFRIVLYSFARPSRLNQSAQTIHTHFQSNRLAEARIERPRFAPLYSSNERHRSYLQCDRNVICLSTRIGRAKSNQGARKKGKNSLRWEKRDSLWRHGTSTAILPPLYLFPSLSFLCPVEARHVPVT